MSTRTAPQSKRSAFRSILWSGGGGASIRSRSLEISPRFGGFIERLSPDLVHHVALQPTIVGSLAAAGLSCARLNAVAGFGFVFTSATLKARLARPVFRALLRYVLANAHASVLVQNPDDRAAIKTLGVADERIFTIRGSGVETDKLTPSGEPPEPITVGFVGRLLADKGVRSLVTAHDILARQGRPMRLLIAGEPDPANPASIPLAEIESWRQRPGIEVLGHVTDIAEFWASHISRFFRHVAKAFQKVCSKRRPVADRSSPLMCLAAAKSRARA